MADKYDPEGWVRLFRALSKPCECEKGKMRDHNGHPNYHCIEEPFPYPGYRWYREELRSLRNLVGRSA